MILFYKNQGETPLQALSRLRAEQPHIKHATLSYAGRLDPMAEGLLLVLVGDENNHREKYLGLDKEYEVEMLCGAETDTYDILGKVRSLNNAHVELNNLEEVLKKFVGTFKQPYPPFSSQPVNGKPLHQWAREGRLSEITIPEKHVTIFSATLQDQEKMLGDELLKNILEKISRVRGDFRQEEITDEWRTLLASYGEKEFTIVRLTVLCSSGTYIRSLVHELGKALKIGACIYSLRRKSIGTWTVNSSA